MLFFGHSEARFQPAAPLPFQAALTAPVVPSKKSSLPSGRPPVELQQAAKALSADNVPGALRRRLDEGIVQPLVRTLGVIVSDVFIDTMPQVRLSKDNHPVQTFRFDAADKPLNERI